ncbi:MAG: RNA-binding protein [Proteobacteria bacterium]|nr:RNA-binding protein [Pseudomonadota bacterium]
MVKNLYVGNLSPEITKEDLLENFKEVGEVVSATVIKDKFSGESKGFGFVEMATEQGAQEAINKFNGGEMSGRKIIVNEAKPRPERSNLSKSGFNKKRGRF